MAKSILISNVLPAEARALIPADVDVDFNDTDTPISKAELIRRLRGKDGLICHIISTIDDEVLAAAPTLRVVSNVAVGFNNIDVAAARKRSIVVTNTPDVLTETTADFAWALLMAAARRVVEADAFARSGQWHRWQWDMLWGQDVYGKTLGILGFGRIGRAVARRARGFNMRVLYHDTVRCEPAMEREVGATYAEADTVLQESDFVSLHTLFIPETRHLINERTLRLMKKTAILVNAARGPIVDEAALVRALSEGWIAGRASTCSRRSRRSTPACRPSRTWCSRLTSPAPPSTRVWPWRASRCATAWPCSRESRRSPRCRDRTRPCPSRARSGVQALRS
jgi:glyoxylate reductase